MSDEYIHEWKAARGYYDPGKGWLSDEECDWWEEQRKEHERSLKRLIPLGQLALRRAFGLLPPPAKGAVDKDEVKSRVDMVELVTSRGAVVRSYGARATGRCPFHDDRMASFSVDVERKLWHCFAGCGGGDCFSFVMKADDCSFIESVRTLNKEF